MTKENPTPSSSSPERSVALACEGLCKTFEGTTVVDDVSFEVYGGETFALLGPSGCGKTTTLRMLAGLERPDGGRVTSGDTVFVDKSVFVPPEDRGVGLVFQQYALFPHLNVVQNVAFGLGVDEARAREMLKRVQLEERASARIDELSGGEQQRVALARALAPLPAALLLDEPFANLDASLRDTVRADVKNLLKSLDATAILVTHDQNEAMGLADRIGVMCDGRLLQVGTPREVYRSPSTLLVAKTLGEGNCLSAIVSDGVVDSALGQTRIDGEPPVTGPCLQFVRPENLHLTSSPSASGAKAEVEQVWFSGSHTMVTARIDSETVVKVRAPADCAVATGESVTVALDGAYCLFPPPN